MLSLIVATDSYYGIGLDNKLLVHIPEDLKRFKEITSNHKIVMGRKTFESLPKLLPNRHHIVITSQNIKNTNDITYINNIDDFIKTYENSEEEVFVIGGANVYKQLAPHCTKFYITQIVGEFEADTYFNWYDGIIDDKQYNIKISDTKEHNNIEYRFIDLNIT